MLHRGLSSACQTCGLGWPALPPKHTAVVRCAAQYISDLVEGMVAVMEGSEIGPFNIGNPSEFTMLELASMVKEVRLN